MSHKIEENAQGKTIYVQTDPELEAMYYTDIREIRDLRELLDGSVDLYADRPVFWTKKKHGTEYVPITYRMFQKDVEAMGTKMLELGWKGRHIAVTGQSCYEWFVTYMAIVNGVGVVVPVDKAFDAKAVGNVLKTADCDILFYTGSEEKKIDEIPGIQHKIRMDFYGDRIDESEEFIIPETKNDRRHWRELLRDGYDLVRSGD